MEGEKKCVLGGLQPGRAGPGTDGGSTEAVGAW